MKSNNNKNVETLHFKVLRVPLLLKVGVNSVPGVWGVCGRDEFGVTGILGVNGFAAGFNTNFFGAFALSVELASGQIIFDVCYAKREKLLPLIFGTYNFVVNSYRSWHSRWWIASAKCVICIDYLRMRCLRWNSLIFLLLLSWTLDRPFIISFFYKIINIFSKVLYSLNIVSNSLLTIGCGSAGDVDCWCCVLTACDDTMYYNNDIFNVFDVIKLI